MAANSTLRAINGRLVAWLFPSLVFCFMVSAPVHAQQHRATRLGNPSTRFADPVQSREDLRRLFTSDVLRADVDFIARESGYRGDLSDLRRAATNANILDLRIPPGTLLPAMSTRKGGKAVLLREVLWAGKEKIEAYEFYFASMGRRYRVVTPRPCANFWVEDYGKELLPVLSIECHAPAEVLLRRTAEVCLTVSNRGEASEPVTRVTLPIPNGSELVSATGSGRPAEGRVVWEIPNLPPGASANLCAVFNAPQLGLLLFAATARGQVSPPVDSRCETRVLGIPAILIEVIDLVDPIEVGQDETYEIQVLNQGSAVLTNVKVACTLPESQEFVSGSGASPVEADGRTITLTALPALNPKDKAVWRVVIKVLKVGDVRFTADVSADQFQMPIQETESTQQY